ELGQPGLAGPPAAFLGAADQVEQLVAGGGGYLVQAQQRGDVLDARMGGIADWIDDCADA
ncbi:MAG: hypothetical protein ACRDS1_01600, partial [Pseudonocardiaceae bacterium]